MLLDKYVCFPCRKIYKIWKGQRENKKIQKDIELLQKEMNAYYNEL